MRAGITCIPGTGASNSSLVSLTPPESPRYVVTLARCSGHDGILFHPLRPGQPLRSGPESFQAGARLPSPSPTVPSTRPITDPFIELLLCARHADGTEDGAENKMHVIPALLV